MSVHRVIRESPQHVPGAVASAPCRTVNVELLFERTDREFGTSITIGGEAVDRAWRL